MKPSTRLLLTSAFAAALAHAPLSHALSLTGIVANGHDVSVDFSTVEHVAADIGFYTPGSVSLTYLLDADDIARGEATFDSIVDNFSSVAFARLTVALDGGRLGVTSFQSNDGTMVVVTQDPRAATFGFSPAYVTQAYLGNPFGADGASDWVIGFDGLSAGDTLTLSVTTAPVPEPGAIALTGTGLGLLALLGRRRRRA